MMESDDLIHWSRPHATFAALNPDHEIYGHTGFAYEGMYIGFRWIELRLQQAKLYSLRVG